MDQPIPTISLVAPSPKTNWLLFLVGGIVILGVGIGIGLFLDKQFYSSNTAQINSYDQCVAAKGSYLQESNPATCVTSSGLRFKGAASSPTPTVDPTANWKTYTNNQEKIAFDYPQNWSLANYDKESIVVGDDRTEGLTIFFGIYSPFALESSTTDKIIEAWFNYNKGSNAQFPDGGKVLSEEFIKVDGFEATKYVLVNNIESSIQPSYQRTWAFVPNNNRITLLDYEGTDNKLFSQILSTFKFLDKPSPTTSTQINGADLKNIKYKLSQGWEAKLNNDSLFISPVNGGGYLSIRVYDYPGNVGRREYYCQVSKVCIEGTSYFTEINIGNISGYIANALDNSGGGPEYFGAKGSKFYIISSYNPPSPNEFEQNYKSVLSSLVF